MVLGIFFSCLFSFAILESSTVNHAFYLSVIEINIDENSNGIMKIKVFKDDMQNALKHKFDDKFLFGEESNSEKFKQKVDAYFQDQVFFAIDDLVITMKNPSITEESDSYWVSYRFIMPLKEGNLYFKTKYFTELFPNQINVLSITCRNNVMYKRLTKNDFEFDYSFSID